MKNPFKSALRESAAMVHVEPVLLGLGAPTPATTATTKTTRATRTTRAHAFAKPLNHLAPLIAQAMKNFTLVAPILLAAAVVMSVMTINQISAFIGAFIHEAKTTEVNNLAPLIDKKPLSAADYQSAANVIAKNNFAVNVALSRERKSIILSIKDPSMFSEFIFALSTIQSYRQGVAWNASTLCLNKCDGANAASAEITGYTQAISFAGLQPK